MNENERLASDLNELKQIPLKSRRCPLSKRRSRPHLATPANDEVERELRPAIIIYKTSFESPSRQGEHAFAALLAVIRPCEQQGDSFFTVAQNILAVVYL